MVQALAKVKTLEDAAAAKPPTEPNAEGWEAEQPASSATSKAAKPADNASHAEVEAAAPEVSDKPKRAPRRSPRAAAKMPSSE